jgi:AraC-like DNA-binding protein
MYNPKSLSNLNPGKPVTWNNKPFPSLAALSRHLKISHSTLQDIFNRDEEVEGLILIIRIKNYV